MDIDALHNCILPSNEQKCRSFQTITGYGEFASTVELRRKIKKAVDQLPPKRLESLSDFVEFLNGPPLTQRLAAAEKAIASGKGTDWR